MVGEAWRAFRYAGATPAAGADADAALPGRSGLRLVVEGPESFAIRYRTAEAAGRSLDVQTYIWHDDPTGNVLAFKLVEAAGRGVRVRLLLDDWDARKNQRLFATLDAHPNIAVRMFNPFASRTGVLGFGGELVGDFQRVNRRMHNKTWIADNRIAIVGGRNIGDEYFGASNEVNFVDLDFAMLGPIVRDASASFDQYWNSEATYPLADLAPGLGTPASLVAFVAGIEAKRAGMEASRFARELRGSDAVQRLVAGDWPMHWVHSARFVALLAGGVQLWEIKPDADAIVHGSLFGSSGASLHTKSLAVDGRTLFVGSFNLDPRSAWLNTEQGVFVESEALVAQFQGLFANDTSGRRAWSVQLDGRSVRWTDDEGTTTRTPKASTWRKLQAWLARVLPFDSQL